MDITNNLTPVELNDPFFKSKIIAMNVWAGYDFTGRPVATGYLTFRDQQTEGRQEFEGRTFDEVVIQIKNFLNRMR